MKSLLLSFVFAFSCCINACPTSNGVSWGNPDGKKESPVIRCGCLDVDVVSFAISAAKRIAQETVSASSPKAKKETEVAKKAQIKTNRVNRSFRILSE